MESIIFVDDNHTILKVYSRLFNKDNKWKCYFVDSAPKALEILETTTVDLIVTDLEMPEMSGGQLLKIVKREYPAIVRIIISGATLNEHHFETVRLAHRFFRKPLNLAAVYDSIVHTFFIQNYLIGEKGRSVLGAIDTIPSYPYIIEEIERELHSANCSITKISTIISKDPGLTSSLLRIINSDYFKLSHEIISVEHAVALVGIEGIKGLILAQNLFEDFPPEYVKTFEIEHFKEHSFFTARFAKVIAIQENWPSDRVEMIFVAGLLHDIGRLVFERSYTKVSLEIVNYLKESKYDRDLSNLEKANIGASHGEAGAYILGLWGISDEIVEAIALHHLPSQAAHCHFPMTTAILHCADQFSYAMSPKFSIDGIERLDLIFLNKHTKTDQVQKWRTACEAIL